MKYMCFWKILTLAVFKEYYHELFLYYETKYRLKFILPQHFIQKRNFYINKINAMLSKFSPLYHRIVKNEKEHYH